MDIKADTSPRFDVTEALAYHLAPAEVKRVRELVLAVAEGCDPYTIHGATMRELLELLELPLDSGWFNWGDEE